MKIGKGRTKANAAYLAGKNSSSDDKLNRTSDGKYKCLACNLSSKSFRIVKLHMICEHPNFVPGKVNGKKINHGISWSDEDLSDNKELFYRTSDLEKINDEFKCICCEYVTKLASNINVHIRRMHPKFIHMPVKATTNTIAKNSLRNKNLCTHQILRPITIRKGMGREIVENKRRSARLSAIKEEQPKGVKRKNNKISQKEKNVHFSSKIRGKKNTVALVTLKSEPEQERVFESKMMQNDANSSTDSVNCVDSPKENIPKKKTLDDEMLSRDLDRQRVYYEELLARIDGEKAKLTQEVWEVRRKLKEKNPHPYPQISKQKMEALVILESIQTALMDQEYELTRTKTLVEIERDSVAELHAKLEEAETELYSIQMTHHSTKMAGQAMSVPKIVEVEWMKCEQFSTEMLVKLELDKTKMQITDLYNLHSDLLSEEEE